MGALDWLSANWIAAAGAIASITTAALLVFERMAADFPIDIRAEASVSKAQPETVLVRILVARDTYGPITVESVTIPGWRLHAVQRESDGQGGFIPIGAQDKGVRRFFLNTRVGSPAGGQGSVALLELAARRRSASKAMPVMMEVQARVSSSLFRRRRKTAKMRTNITC